MRGTDRVWHRVSIVLLMFPSRLTRIGVVVSKNRKDGSAGNEGFDHVVYRHLGVLGIVVRQLVLRFVRDQIAGVNTPRELVAFTLVVRCGASQRADGLQC